MNGKKHGEGSVSFSDKSYYKGKFKNGVIEGNGIYTFADKKIYKGAFSKNCI